MKSTWRKTILTKDHPEARPLCQKTTWWDWETNPMKDHPDELVTGFFNDAPAAHSQLRSINRSHYQRHISILLWSTSHFPRQIHSQSFWISKSTKSVLLDLEIRNVNLFGSTNPQSQSCWIYKSATSILLDLQVHKVIHAGSTNPQSQSCWIYKSATSILWDLQIHKVNPVGSTNPQCWIYKSTKSIMPFGSTNPQSKSANQSFSSERARKRVLKRWHLGALIITV